MPRLDFPVRQALHDSRGGEFFSISGRPGSRLLRALKFIVGGLTCANLRCQFMYSLNRSGGCVGEVGTGDRCLARYLVGVDIWCVSDKLSADFGGMGFERCVMVL